MARVLFSKQVCPLQLTPWEVSRKLMRAEELKNITFFIMGQNIRRKDLTCSKSVESKLLSSVFISGQTSTFFFKRAGTITKGKREG